MCTESSKRRPKKHEEEAGEPGNLRKEGSDSPKGKNYFFQKTGGREIRLRKAGRKIS